MYKQVTAVIEQPWVHPAQPGPTSPIHAPQHPINSSSAWPEGFPAEKPLTSIHCHFQHPVRVPLGTPLLEDTPNLPLVWQPGAGDSCRSPPRAVWGCSLRRILNNPHCPHGHCSPPWSRPGCSWQGAQRSRLFGFLCC